MTWKRIKRKSLARLQRIRTKLDSGRGGENTNQDAFHSVSEQVALGQDRCCFLCGEPLRSLHKQILGISADKVTMLLTNMSASVSSRLRKATSETFTVAWNINSRSAARGSESETRYREIIDTSMHMLSPAVVGATRRRSTWNFRTGRRENDLFSDKCKKDKWRSLWLHIAKNPLVGQQPSLLQGGRRLAVLQLKQTGYSHSATQVERQDGFYCRERELTLLLKNDLPVPTRLHCHTLPVPGQINTTQRTKEHTLQSAHIHSLTAAHSQVCTKWWYVSFLFCASQCMRSLSTEV